MFDTPRASHPGPPSTRHAPLSVLTGCLLPHLTNEPRVLQGNLLCWHAAYQRLRLSPASLSASSLWLNVSTSGHDLACFPHTLARV